MEIYRNDTAQVKIDLPVTATNDNVAAYSGDTLLYTFGTVLSVSGGYAVNLPFSLVDQDRSFDIKWSFNYTENSVVKTYTRTTHIDVVTPYVTVQEIKDALGIGVEAFTDAELERAERRIRGVVENFTGQKFGRYSGSYNVQSTGEEDLLLPARLITLTGIQNGYSTNVDFYGTRGDGWYLATATPYVDVNTDWVFDNVIRTPGSYAKGIWRDNQTYTLTGDWGYEDVPTNVKEATLILIEDMLCPDSEYRDRYVTLVKTADFSLQYDKYRAFMGTGSVIADQLLAEYIRPNLVVI